MSTYDDDDVYFTPEALEQWARTTLDGLDGQDGDAWASDFYLGVNGERLTVADVRARMRGLLAHIAVDRALGLR